jgi:DNA-directed RNA polymerase subunit RPC12/RpoP
MGATYYIQICPTCGRRLEIKIEYIRLEVSCYHCRARFIAENLRSQPIFALHVVSAQGESTMSYSANQPAETVSALF